MFIRTLLTLSLLTWGGSVRCFAQPATGDEPEPPVVPVHYALHLEPSLQTGRFEGAEEIVLQVRVPTSAVVLDALGLEIRQAALRDNEDRAVELTVEVDAASATVRLSAADAIAPGEHRLSVRFAGELGHEAHGLYLSGTPGTPGAVLAADLAPRSAREVFPCFDDPRFRAGARLSLKVPKRLRVVSNGSRVAEQPIGPDEKIVVLADCPPMPLHLLGFVAGEFGATEDSFGPVRLRFLTVPGKEALARRALDFTKVLLREYEDLFGMPFPLPKLDQVALPDPFVGDITGWGFVAYPEPDVLVSGNHALDVDGTGLFQELARALARQWVGSAVGFATWDEVWLGPGLAAWAEGEASQRLHPEWKAALAERPALDARMRQDALPGSLPLQRPLRGEEVAAAFRDFDASKARRILRMVEALTGQTAFVDGVKSYLATYRGRAARAKEFWSAIDSKSDRNVSAWAGQWFSQPGFPLIRVTSQCVNDRRIVSLEQSRFMLTTGEPGEILQSWTVPVGLLNVGTGERARYALLSRVSDNFETGRCRTPLKANPGDVGYFRVWYEPALVSELEAEGTALDEADRVNLVSDVFATVEMRRTPVAVFLHLADRWRDDPSLNVWRAVRHGLTELDGLAAGDPGRGRFQKAVCDLLRPRFTRLGWTAVPDEPAERGAERAELVETLGRFGDRDVIDEAFRRFELLAQRPEAVAGTLDAAALVVAGRYANDSAFRALETMAASASTPGDRRLCLRAMAGALDPDLAARFLQSEDTVSDQNPRTLASLLAEVAGDAEHADLVWSYLQGRRDLLDNPQLWQDDALATALARGLTDPEGRQAFLAQASVVSSPRLHEAFAERQIQTEAAVTVVPALNEWVDAVLDGRAAREGPVSVKGRPGL